MDNANWISNLDQMPPPNKGAIFANMYSGEIVVASIGSEHIKPIQDGTIGIFYPLPYDNVLVMEATHWMPLPLPPKNK